MEFEYGKTPRGIIHQESYKGHLLIVTSCVSHPCGYVSVNQEHPLYGVDYSSDLFSEIYGDRYIPHGWFTFSSDKVCDVKGWFLGWDYHHAWDYYVHNEYGNNHLIGNGHQWTVAEIVTECKNVIDALVSINTVQPPNGDIKWKPMSEFPTLEDEPKLKEKNLVVMTDMGYVFSAYYEGRKGFACASIRNGKVEFDTYEQKHNLVWWAYTGA